MGCQYIQEKAKVHFGLQIPTLVGRSIGASQCALQKIVLQLIPQGQDLSCFGYCRHLPGLLWEVIFSTGRTSRERIVYSIH